MNDERRKSDSELVPIDEGTLHVLVNNHARFRKFLSKRVGSEADADEILQQSLSKAVESPPDSNSPESILAWFFRVLRNGLTDYYRARASEDRKYEALARESRDEAPTPEEHAEICGCMKELLPTLKPEYAEALRRVDLEEQSPDQVAAGLGIARNTLDVRLHRARKALKATLVRACGTCTEHGCLDCTCG